MNLKFILGLNNSTLFAWLLYKFIYSNAIRSTRYDGQYVGRMPVPSMPLERQKPIIALVERILAAKRKNPAADTSKLEREIDNLVYALYGLTPDEIAIVEGREGDKKQTISTAKPARASATRQPRKSVMTDDPNLA